MNSNRLKLFAIAFIAIFTFAGCGSDSNSEEVPSQPRRFGKTNFDPGQCDNSPMTGKDFSSLQFSNPQRKIEYFDKSFYPEFLKNALQASSYSVAKAVFEEGVDLYQVQSNATLECRYFDFLTPAPSEVQKRWNSENKSSGSGTSSLLGLFTTTYTKNTQTGETKLTKPTITIIDSTQKWTLLHEMSHFLFAKARTTTPHLPFNTEIESEIKKTKSKILSLKVKVKSEAKARELVRLYRDFFFDNHELDRRSALEEFSIESMLINYNKLGLISGVENTTDKENGLSYMLTNADPILTSYNRFLDELKKTKTDIVDDSWAEAQDEIDALIADIEEIQQFIRDRLIDAWKTVQPEAETALYFSAETDSHRQWHHFDKDAFLIRHQQFQKW